MVSKEHPKSDGIAARLRMARERRNLSQSELSLLAVLNRKCCHDIESGKGSGNVGVHTLERLARVLDVSVAWLAFGEDDSQERIAALLRELVRVREEQFALAAHEEEEEEDEEEEDDDKDSGDEGWPGARKQTVGPVWPNGYRPFGYNYWELPPLERHYAPVLEALPRLSERRQFELGQVLVSLIGEYANLDQVWWIRELLLSVMPARDRPVLDLVMQDLGGRDWARRGLMALSLIVDGGLPVMLGSLEAMRCCGLPEKLERALLATLEMLKRHDPTGGRRQLPAHQGS
jgi:transcriptional regulator with XRE-family HTH domain